MKQNKKGLTPKKQDPRWKLTEHKSLADWDKSFYEKPWYEENEHKRYRVRVNPCQK